jgi:hypothetical protein
MNKKTSPFLVTLLEAFRPFGATAARRGGAGFAEGSRPGAQPHQYSIRAAKGRAKNGELTRNANYDTLNNGGRDAAPAFFELLYYI